jgi:hypothetical protein
MIGFTLFQLVVILGLMAAAFIGGMAFTRYMAKRDPERLQRWYADAKVKGDKLRDEFRS